MSGIHNIVKENRKNFLPRTPSCFRLLWIYAMIPTLTKTPHKKEFAQKYFKQINRYQDFSMKMHIFYSPWTSHLDWTLSEKMDVNKLKPNHSNALWYDKTLNKVSFRWCFTETRRFFCCCYERAFEMNQFKFYFNDKIVRNEMLWNGVSTVEYLCYWKTQLNEQINLNRNQTKRLVLFNNHLNAKLCSNAPNM